MIKVGVDIDGTITRPDTFLPFINAEYGLGLTYEMVQDYNLAKSVPVPATEFWGWFKKNEPIFYQLACCANGAKEVLDELYLGASVHLISARGKEYVGTTLDWLFKYEIQYSSVTLLGSDRKVESVKSKGLDVFIEDRYETAVEVARECQIPVLLINTPYNQGESVENVFRVNSWFDVRDWIGDLLGEDYLRQNAG